VRRAARDILSRPEFQRPPRSVVQIVLDWLGRLLDRITSFTGGSTLVGLAIMVGALAVIAFLLTRFARSVRGDPSRDIAVSVDVGRSAVDWRAQADAAEGAGDWREALRCRYRALLADLAARGTLEEVPGRTTGEYRAALARVVPGAAGDFSAATGLFEEAWYGSVPTGAAENGRFRELADRVLVGAGR
jgi:hypothetical protein